jgi:hypothetical protein
LESGTSYLWQIDTKYITHWLFVETNKAKKEEIINF